MSSEARRKRKRPPRKALHAIRREEIEQLTGQLRGLERTFQELQQRAEVVGGRGEDASDQQAKFARRVLRLAVQRRQRADAPTLRLLTEYALFDIRAGSPLHRFIRLPKELGGRREELLSLRESVLRHGEEFLHSRFAWIDPRVMMRDHLSFEAPDGDYCLAHVSTFQFAGRATVRGVFDAVTQFFRNIEIVLSERLGSVTIREDDQHGDGGASQNRLVSFTPVRNLVIESNYAVFSRFDEEDESANDEVVNDERQRRRKKGYGIAVFDYVDQDELYPYQPEQRARRDATAVVEVTARTRPRRRGNRRMTRQSEGRKLEYLEGEDEEDEEEIVTMIHSVNMRLHRPVFLLPEGGWHELRQISERWVSSLQFALQEIYVPSEGGLV